MYVRAIINHMYGIGTYEPDGEIKGTSFQLIVHGFYK
jgi:hypothetical protein